MRNNDLVSKMSPRPHLAFSPDARIPRAVEALRPLTAGEISQIMIARLERQRTLENGLPPCQRDEEPVDIFVDVMMGAPNETFAEKIRFACQDALRVAFSESLGADVMGNLCYLAAAIGAVEALDYIRLIASDEKFDQSLLADGESVRSRALRALVGLLAQRPSHDATIKTLFLNLLPSPEYRLLALTGLVGLWPQEREAFLAMVPGAQIDDRDLNINLDLIGFGYLNTATRH
jgi:hypothetical protein